jgi:hypothetical protein
MARNGILGYQWFGTVAVSWSRITALALRLPPWSITYFYKLMSNWVLDAHPCTLAAIQEYDERMNHADKLPGRDYKPEK